MNECEWMNEFLFAAPQLTNGGILLNTMHNKQNIHKKQEKLSWNYTITNFYTNCKYACFVLYYRLERERKKDCPLF